MTAVKQKDRPAHQQQHQVKPHHRDTADGGNFSDFIDPFDGNKGHHDHPAGRQNTDRLRRSQATSAQVWVLSAPNKKVDSGTQILAAVLTIHTTYEANHIKVPMKAKRGPTLWFIQE